MAGDDAARASSTTTAAGSIAHPRTAEVDAKAGGLDGAAGANRDRTENRRGLRGAAGEGQAGIRTLCVDDSPTYRALLHTTFSALRRFEATIVGSPVKAYQLAMRAMLRERPFELFLLDIEMEEIDGLMLLDRIRHLSGYENTPVYFISATRDAEHRKVARERAKGLVSKGDPETLAADLKHLLGRLRVSR